MESTSTLSNNLHTYYQKKLLTIAESTFQMRKFADEKVHPRGNGKDYYLLRYGNMAANTNALTEGQVPTENTIDTNKYTVSIVGYGEYVKVTDLLDLTAIDPVIDSITERMAYHASQKMDTLIQNELISNATNNLYYVNARANDAAVVSTDTFQLQDVIKGVTYLKGGDAQKLSDGSYAWVIHPNMGMDIMADTSAGGYQELYKYQPGLKDSIMIGELGRAYGARVVESSNIQKVANGGSVNVYRSFILARNSFCMTKFNEDAVEIIVKQLGQSGSADPLNQIGTVGYKMYFGLKYLGGSFTNHNGASPDLCIQVRGTSSVG